MDRHNKERIEKAIRTLKRAQGQMETALLYLGVNEPDPLKYADVLDANEHINIATDRLSAVVDHT